MFGISFTEILLILAVALVVVGPQKLPGLLGTLGNYIGKLRRMATEMRKQTGIDDILRQEGLEGGINELRGLLRTDNLYAPATRRRPLAAQDPYESAIQYDRTREYPTEGADAYGAIPEDLAEGLLGGSSDLTANAPVDSEPEAGGRPSTVPPDPTEEAPSSDSKVTSGAKASA